MTTILAIDASTGPCSVAIWAGNAVHAYVENSKPVMQSASLIPMIEQALAQAGLSYNGISAVAATIGPGSFTGIRVGLASARGIAFAAGIPSMGYTTLDVLAYAASAQSLPYNNTVLAVLMAGKGEYYYQHDFFAARLGSLEEALAASGTAPVTTAGNIAIDRPGFIACGVTFPRADILAEMAARSSIAAQALRPFYIRPPDAKLPSNS